MTQEHPKSVYTVYVKLERMYKRMDRRDSKEGIGDRFQQETKYLDSCQVGAFYDDEVNALLDVDGTEESVIYMTVVGKRQ